ncbi:MAG: site-specific DNA-methyltransferase [Sphaerospermopsis sp. SIO1G2]|nr:site-specific DNA-methyltransferase [Sphaerospermopsis sp. SIO1G2]
MTDTAPNTAAITSPDMQEQRVQELKRLFPDLFDGEGKLDESALRALMQTHGASGAERFRFEWAGKQESKRRAFTPSRATLVADTERSVDFDTTQNLIIEGDNLEVLKLLQTTYFEQVKCIYIDPPYNTGNDFIYPDNFAEGKRAYWQKNGTVKDGVKLQANSEATGRRHSNWLNMMQSRLLIARQLLREDGVIFISIDDHEQANLKKLCDEIFGKDNFVGCLMWKRRVSSALSENNVSTDHEYVLCYSKEQGFEAEGIAKDYSKYKNADNDPRGDWIADNLTVGMNASMRPNQAYDLIDPSTGISYPFNPNRVWAYIPETMEKMIEEGRIIFPSDPTKRPMLKRYKNELKTNRNPFSTVMIDTVGLNTEATRAMQEIMGGSIFEYSKPLSLFNTIIPQVANENDIVLDFFAGSGTTAHAVMSRNAQDSGNRRYILVQIPEYTDEKSEAFKAGYKTISDICIERVKRAGTKIKEENPDAQIDTGFRVYKLTDSHFPENLFTSDAQKSEADNLAALEAHIKAASERTLFPAENMANIITEISLKNGYGLFFTLEQLTTDFPQNTVYRLSGNDKSTLLCLDESIHEDTVDTLVANFSDGQLIISKHGLDTAKKWALQNSFKDNMQVV